MKYYKKELNDKKWLIDHHINKQLTIKEIAKILNVHPSTIRKAFKRLNIENQNYNRKKRIENQWLADKGWLMEAHHGKKQTAKQIATNLNVSVETVLKSLKFHNIEAVNYYTPLKSCPEMDNREWLLQQRLHYKKTMYQIADMLGVHYLTVLSACNYHQIPRIRCVANDGKRGFVHHLLRDKDWLYQQHVVDKKRITDISIDIGVDVQTIGKALKFHGIDTIYHEKGPENDLLANKEWLNDQHTIQKKSVSQIAYELNCGAPTVIKALRYHNIEFIRRSGTSNRERELIDFIRHLLPLGEINTNVRNIIPPKELDIFIPSKKIAFEFNGSFWHSEHSYSSGDLKYKHLRKTEECEEKGIQLIHINEYDWVNNRSVVESRIRSVVNVTDKIYARNTTVSEIEKVQSKQLLDIWHLQQRCNSSVEIALFYNQEPVAIMTFGKPRFNKKIEWELLRFCSKPGINVIGGASKLFSYFIKQWNPKSVISYADRQWSQGQVYEKLGFQFSHFSSPSYKYLEPVGSETIVHNRIKFQKHKLKDKLKAFDPKLTESQNMFNNGYWKIWDCGNSVWFWKP